MDTSRTAPKETTDQLLARMRATYGGAPAAAPEPVAAPAPAPVQAQKREPSGLLQRAAGLMKSRTDQIDRAAGYANGGKISGPGTATSDSIPAQVQETGEPIKVSNTERIVSAKQEAALARIAEMLGFETVDAMFESMTGVPVGPTVKGGELAASTGLSPYEEGRKKILSQMAPQQPAPPASKVYSDVGLSSANYDPASVGQPQPTGTPGAAWSKLSDVLSHSDDREAIKAKNATVGQKPMVPQPATGDYNSGYDAKEQARANAVSVTQKPTAMAGAQQAGPVTTDVGNGIRRVTEAGKPTMYSNVEPGAGVVDDSASAKRDAQSGDPYWSPAAQLERMQMRRMMSDATDPSITDPNVRETAQKGLALLNATQTAGVDRDLKKALLDQTKTIEAMLSKLLDRNTPPEELAALRENMRAINGKGGSDKYTSHVVGGGVNEMGQAQPQHLAVTNPDGTVRFHSPGQQGQPQAQAKPSYEQFASQMNARYGGKVTPEQLKQAYAKQYGA